MDETFPVYLNRLGFGQFPSCPRFGLPSEIAARRIPAIDPPADRTRPLNEGTKQA